jgi:tetratricopeptide (TPR) repeat protein
MGWVPPWLGCVAYRLGDLDEARALIEAGLALHDPDGPWWELSFALLSLGEVTRAQGELARAAALYAHSLRMVVAHGARPDVPAHLEGFAKLAIAAGDSLRAARLWGAAEALRAQIGIPVPPVERADYERAVAAARAAARAAGDPDGFTPAWAEGRAWRWEQAADYALALTPAPPGAP